jgi:hypothetical protein
MLSCFAACAGHGRKKPSFPTAVSEKQAVYQDSPSLSRQQTVDELLLLIRSTDISTKQLSAHLEDTLHAQGWWDALAAQALLGGIWRLIEIGAAEISPTFKSNLDKAIAEARNVEELAMEFAGEHPILTAAVCAFLALGVLWLIWPAALELLGFGAEGPIAGKSIWNCL